MTTNAKGLTIRARRWYATREIPELGIRSETIRVTGFQSVEVGIAGSEEWPLRTETWCRFRSEGERTSGLLIHPDQIAVALND